MVERLDYMSSRTRFTQLRTVFKCILHAPDRSPEVDSDVISGVAVGYVGVDVHVKFVDSISNRSQDIRLPHSVTDQCVV